MMYDYSEKKKELLSKLTDLAERLDEIKKETGVEFEEIQEKIDELKQKVANTISNIENEKFSIALFGAFSDGKSTILSALTKSLDIKVSVEPTTDEIKEYKYEDYLILDTPGLFSDQLMHEEKTKKYISEANVILYVVDAVNPLKESHHKTLKWLLKDLGKIDSTIFVINKMDEVADLNEDEDFERNCKIKKEVVREVLRKVVGARDFKRIVCVSGDPFGLGLKEWFSRENDYRKISRIGNLENIINEFIEKAKKELITKSGLSVIKDVVIRTLDELEKLREELEKGVLLLNNQINECENKLKTLEQDINKSYIDIKNDMISLREDILLKIEAASDTKELESIFQNEVGKDGYIIDQKIDLIIRKNTEKLESENQKTLKSMEESLEYHSDLFKELISKSTTKISRILLSKSDRELANLIIMFRNFSKIPVKFKPWGAIKLARKIKTIPIFISAIFLIGEIYEKIKFNKAKEQMKQQTEDLFQNYLQSLTFEVYRDEYCPNVVYLEKVLDELKNSRNEIQRKIDVVERNFKKLENIMGNL